MPGHQVVDKPVVGPLTTGPSQTFCPPAGGSAMTVWIFRRSGAENRLGNLAVASP